MQKFRQAFTAFKGKAAAFFRARGYYIALTACILVLCVAAVVAFSAPQGGEDTPNPTDAPVAYSNDERLNEAARTPVLPLPTPSPPLRPRPRLFPISPRRQGPQRPLRAQRLPRPFQARSFGGLQWIRCCIPAR